MKRNNETIPDTEYFHFFNANSKNKIGGDCVIRAIATVLDQTWEDTVLELTELGLKYGYVLNDKKCYEKYLIQKGWIKCSEPKNWDNTRMKVYQFLKYNKEGNLIAYVGTHHIVAVINNKVYDIWNSSYQTMHSYWRKK